MRVLTTARLALEEQAATLDPRTGRPRRLKPPAPPVELPPSAAKRFEPPAPQTVLLELSELSPRTRIAHRLYECSKAQLEMGRLGGHWPHGRRSQAAKGQRERRGKIFDMIIVVVVIVDIDPGKASQRVEFGRICVLDRFKNLASSSTRART